MKLFDPEGLMPDHKHLISVVASHPFDNSLVIKITTIAICCSEMTLGIPDEKIDMYKGEVFLGVGKLTYLKNDYNSILYHEFGHVADRMDSKFQYSEDLKSELSESEKTCVMELWNVYINSRLNAVGLYTTSGSECCGILNGEDQVFPGTVEGDLTRYQSSTGLPVGE